MSDADELLFDGAFLSEEQEYLENIHEEKEKPFSYFDLLDAPRYLPEPVDLTLDHLRQIAYELGLIKLCWPEITDPEFESRTNFPRSYLRNNSKEKLLLLYAENFRRQFCFKYPSRKPLFLASENECGMQKMVCTTIRPTTLPYPEIETWQDCVKFVGNQLKYEPLEDEPTIIPRRLYSPHTTFLRQSGQSFELATALCSLLIGLGYDAYVVSGYAIIDVTMRIMSRVDSPYPPTAVEEEVVEEVVVEEKYKLRPPRDLRSKFLLMMEQREIDRAKAEEEKIAEAERQRILKEEERPFDELEGLRIHSWVLLLAGERNVENTIFIEPSTGLVHPLDSPLYCGVESVWSNANYWVNMQDCSEGMETIEYDLTNTEKWEHLLVGEPLKWRKEKPKDLGDEEDALEMADEKHLDMPISWSMRINIPHEVLKKLFPDGMKETYYKRTCVEEFAPYVTDDGLLTRITRFSDFDCTEVLSVEEKYENRRDNLYRTLYDVRTNQATDYFQPGREDRVVKHIYYRNHDAVDAERTIFFKSKARYDALSKIECTPEVLTEYYDEREDKMYFRQITYITKAEMAAETLQGGRRPILQIIQKFNRNEDKPSCEDIATRIFELVERVIHLKYHYGTGNVTASTRTFIKPPLAEMGEGMVFKPELTYGYQAEIGSKPPRQLALFLLLEEQLKEEELVIVNIRDRENQIAEFLMQRAHEMAFPKLDVSLFNKEQNWDYRLGMLEKEEQQRVYKEKEVEEEIDYLAPYLARMGNPSSLRYQKALDVKYTCLNDFKQLLVERANSIQRAFDKQTEQLQAKQAWYTLNHDNLSPEEEVLYFEEINHMIANLRTLEMRLNRHKDLSPLRYQAILTYLNHHPLLSTLNKL